MVHLIRPGAQLRRARYEHHWGLYRHQVIRYGRVRLTVRWLPYRGWTPVACVRCHTPAELAKLYAAGGC